MRSGNGGEYTSNDFDSLSREAGIKIGFIVPYHPHKNGVAERKNRSRVDTAKSMVHYLDLPMFLLGRGMLYNSLHT